MQISSMKDWIELSFNRNIFLICHGAVHGSIHRFNGSSIGDSLTQEKLRAAAIMCRVFAPPGHVWPSSRWDISVVDYSGMLIL